MINKLSIAHGYPSYGPFSRTHWSGSTLLVPAEDLAERYIQVIECSGAVTCEAGAMHGERFGLQVGELFQSALVNLRSFVWSVHTSPPPPQPAPLALLLAATLHPRYA